MNDNNTPITPGQHLGELPNDPAVQLEIQQANAAGNDTCMSGEYAAMIDQGIEPDVWRLAA